MNTRSPRLDPTAAISDGGAGVYVEAVEPGSCPAGEGLVSGATSNVVGQAMIVVATFFSTPYIVRQLGPAQYGTMSLLVTYLFSFSLLNLGINTSLVKYVAELLPQGRVREVQQYIGTAMTVLTAAGAAVSACIFALAPGIVRHFFDGPERMVDPTILAVRIASAGFVLQFMSQVASAVPIAAQRFDLLNLVRTGTDLFRIIGSVCLLALGFRLPALLMLTLFTGALALLAYSVVSARLVPAVAMRPGFSLPHLRSLFGHSRHVLVSNASIQAVSVCDTFLIGAFCSASALAYYHVGFTLAQRLWSFIGNVASVAFPAAAAFNAVGDTRRLGELYVRTTKITAAAACFPAIALVVFAGDLLRYWIGQDFAAHGTLLLRLLASAFLLHCFVHVPFQVLQGTSYASVAAKCWLAYVGLLGVLFIVLIPAFGTVGASVAYLAAELVIVPWFITAANKRVGIDWSELLARSYFRVILATVSAVAPAVACRSSISSLGSLAVVVGGSFLVYVGVATVLVLDHTDHAACRALLRRITGTARPAWCRP